MKTHKRTRRMLAVAASLMLVGAVQAHDKPAEMSAEEKAVMEAYQKAGAPGEPHAMMAKMAGDYSILIKSWYAPGAPPTESTGSVTRKLILGGRVMTESMQSTMMGEPFTGHGMQGYDNVTGRYWSTWNDSMSTGVMVADGSCKDDGSCVFSGSWHDPLTKEKVTSRMLSRTTSTGEVFEMYGPGPDGKEAKMMEITYTRK